MHNEETDNGEWLSALVDGRLQGEEFARALAAVAMSDDALSNWHAYHVAGDVMRCPDLAACRGDRAFVARLRRRLVVTEEREPVVMIGGGNGVVPPPPNGRENGIAASANDAVMRWKWFAAAASVAAVATMGWHLSQLGTSGSAQLATTAPSSSVVAATVAQPSGGEPPRMLRDPRLDELLAAHRQLGGTSALQMPAGFLRNATFEQPTR